MTKTYYVGRVILSQYSELLSRRYGRREEHHITLAYSKVWFPYRADLQPTIVLRPPFSLTSFGKLNVMLVQSEDLTRRHEELKNAGASWSYPEFNAHISVGDRAFEPVDFPIVAGQEYYGTWEEP